MELFFLMDIYFVDFLGNMDEPSQKIIDTLLLKLQELRDIAVQSDAAKELINKIQGSII